MKIDPLLSASALFNDIRISYVDIAGRSPAMGRQTSASKMSQYHLPDGADGCCIT